MTRPAVPGVPELLTTAEAAAALGVSRRTVNYYAQAGKLPAAKTPLGRGHWRIQAAAVRAEAGRLARFAAGLPPTEEETHA